MSYLRVSIIVFSFAVKKLLPHSLHDQWYTSSIVHVCHTLFCLLILHLYWFKTSFLYIFHLFFEGHRIGFVQTHIKKVGYITDQYACCKLIEVHFDTYKWHSNECFLDPAMLRPMLMNHMKYLLTILSVTSDETSWRTEVTFIMAWRCCDVFVT